jgi:hypothetical protein
MAVDGVRLLTYICSAIPGATMAKELDASDRVVRSIFLAINGLLWLRAACPR